MPSLTRPRRTYCIALLAFGALAGVAYAAQPVYPIRPVRLVIGFPPGGSIDVLARIVAPRLSGAFGQH